MASEKNSLTNWQMQCSICGKNQYIIRATIEENHQQYDFDCGHSHKATQVKDSGRGVESLTGKFRKGYPGAVKPYFVVTDKVQSSGNSQLPDGVRQVYYIDRENDHYDKRVIDLHTEKVICEKHETLSEHTSKYN
jgi:hypothetical protein